MVLDYFRGHVRYQPLDQVNLIFQGLDNPDQLLTDVLQVLDKAGWEHGGQDNEYLLEFDDHFRHQTEWRTNGRFGNRYHVRFWRGNGEILASAHKERLRKWPYPRHDPTGFDDAKWVIAQVFSGARWTVHLNARQIGPPIVDPTANGWASVIIRP